MKNSEVKNIAPGVDWVGILDFDIVTFDVVMETKYGTSYNSYLVQGKEKIALIEASKSSFWEDYIEKVKSMVNPADIDYIVLNHTEPDHSGVISDLLKVCPKAVVVASGTASKYLSDMLKTDFPSMVVKDGDSLDLGGKTLQFISAPNLHWPDSMYTYIPEDKLLFTCDSFGAHYADHGVFDDKVGVFDDAFKYYYWAILRPFSKFFLKAIEKVEKLPLAAICTGHGPILRKNWKKYLDLSKKWSLEYVALPNPNKVLVAYVSAYGYTGMLAEKIAEGVRSEGFEVDLCDLEKIGAGDISIHLEQASAFLFGSSTINQSALPPIYNCFANITPLRDKGKAVGGFGSYGWSGEAKGVIENCSTTCKLSFTESYFVKFKPNEEELKGAFDFGARFAKGLKQ